MVGSFDGRRARPLNQVLGGKERGRAGFRADDHGNAIEPFQADAVHGGRPATAELGGIESSPSAPRTGGRTWNPASAKTGRGASNPSTAAGVWFNSNPSGRRWPSAHSNPLAKRRRRSQQRSATNRGRSQATPARRTAVGSGFLQIATPPNYRLQRSPRNELDRYPRGRRAGPLNQVLGARRL